MRIRRISPKATQLTLYPSFFPISAYLVEDEDGLTLVDTTLPGQGPAILRAVAALGAPLRRIVLTHAHGDHVGAAAELARAVPDVELMLSARDARIAEGDRTLDPGEAAGALRGSFQAIGAPLSRRLQDGDRIGALEAVATPGHTPGHFAFLNHADGTLFGGDLLFSQGGLVVSGVLNWRFPIGPIVTWSLATALASTRRIQALRPERLALGHGPVIEDPAQALEQAIIQSARKLA